MSRDPATRGRRPTIVVSGLPRSGTSLMMQILERAGLPLLHDEIRGPDPSNPRGYYEYAPVRATRRDAAWVEAAEGRAVKVIHALLPALPRDRTYRVLLMQRDLREVVASQDAMLARRDETVAGPGLERLVRIHSREMQQTRALLDREDCFDWLPVDHGALLREPERVLSAVRTFLSIETSLAELARCIDPTLHRTRAPDLPG